MSKNDKKADGNSKLSKLKKVIKKLKIFEDKLKSKEKKIDKKLNKSDKLKKGEIKKLKEKFADSENKSKKISKELKKKKDEVKKIKNKKSKLAKKEQKILEKDPITVTSNYSVEELFQSEMPVDHGNEEPELIDTSLPKSLNFNSKDAIAYIRSITNESAVDMFIKNDKRSTVKQAANSRKNALGKSKK